MNMDGMCSSLKMAKSLPHMSKAVALKESRVSRSPGKAPSAGVSLGYFSGNAERGSEEAGKQIDGSNPSCSIETLDEEMDSYLDWILCRRQRFCYRGKRNQVVDSLQHQ